MTIIMVTSLFVWPRCDYFSKRCYSPSFHHFQLTVVTVYLTGRLNRSDIYLHLPLTQTCSCYPEISTLPQHAQMISHLIEGLLTNSCYPEVYSFPHAQSIFRLTETDGPLMMSFFERSQKNDGSNPIPPDFPL